MGDPRFSNFSKLSTKSIISGIIEVIVEKSNPLSEMETGWLSRQYYFDKFNKKKEADKKSLITQLTSSPYAYLYTKNEIPDHTDYTNMHQWIHTVINDLDPKYQQIIHYLYEGYRGLKPEHIRAAERTAYGWDDPATIAAHQDATDKRDAALRAAREAAAAEADRQGVATLDQCKETLARFREENAKLVDRLAKLTGAAGGGARKRSRKNRRRRSKRTRRH